MPQAEAAVTKPAIQIGSGNLVVLIKVLVVSVGRHSQYNHSESNRFIIRKIRFLKIR